MGLLTTCFPCPPLCFHTRYPSALSFPAGGDAASTVTRKLRWSPNSTKDSVVGATAILTPGGAAICAVYVEFGVPTLVTVRRSTADDDLAPPLLNATAIEGSAVQLTPVWTRPGSTARAGLTCPAPMANTPARPPSPSMIAFPCRSVMSADVMIADRTIAGLHDGCDDRTSAAMPAT
nr:unnamed protein product [Digitaria exilis]